MPFGKLGVILVSGESKSSEKLVFTIILYSSILHSL